MKNRCASDETDSLVSSRAEESSQTRGAEKRSGTDHCATGFHCAGPMATPDFHAATRRSLGGGGGETKKVDVNIKAPAVPSKSP